MEDRPPFSFSLIWWPFRSGSPGVQPSGMNLLSLSPAFQSIAEACRYISTFRSLETAKNGGSGYRDYSICMSRFNVIYRNPLIIDSPYIFESSPSPYVMWATFMFSAIHYLQSSQYLSESAIIWPTIYCRWYFMRSWENFASLFGSADKSWN
jgi:hypothetical protein